MSRVVNTIGDILRKSGFIRAFARVLRARSKAILYRLSPVLLAILRFRAVRGRWPNLEEPESFDEKLLWLMLFWRDPLKARCGDKYGLRGYVEEHDLGHLLPSLIGVYTSSSEIDFTSLPDRFVLKCTHGCKMNVLCRDKGSLDIEATKRKLEAWIKVDYGAAYGEVHYSKMVPRIICEVFLDGSKSELPSDYKVYCFSGKAHCTLACTERQPNGSAKYDFYDRAWRNKLSYGKSSLLSNRNISKPQSYDEMIDAAERLSKPFPFVRVDFYDIGGRAVIGEMTFTPAGCIDPGYTDAAQAELGRLVVLPPPRSRLAE